MTNREIAEEIIRHTPWGVNMSEEQIEAIVAGVDAALKAEREACAKIADEHHDRLDANGYAEHGSQCLDWNCNESIAKAIRARSKCSGGTMRGTKPPVWPQPEAPLSLDAVIAALRQAQSDAEKSAANARHYGRACDYADGRASAFAFALRLLEGH